MLYRERPGDVTLTCDERRAPGRFRYSRLKEASRQMLRVRTVESLKSRPVWPSGAMGFECRRALWDGGKHELTVRPDVRGGCCMEG